MSMAALFSPGVTKEIRALLPTWLASAAAIFAAAVAREPASSALPSFGFAIGAVALGASIRRPGITHRTLPLLLSLPSDRRRLLLAETRGPDSHAADVERTGLADAFQDPDFVKQSGIDARVLIGAAIAAFFLAPWLTMICKSSLAGTVFSIVVPALLLIAGDLIGLALYGSGGGALIDHFKLSFLWRGLFVLSAVAAVSGWRMFARLEAIDGRGADMQTPDWLLGDAPTRSRAAASASPSALAAGKKGTPTSTDDVRRRGHLYGGLGGAHAVSASYQSPAAHSRRRNRRVVILRF